MIKMIKNNILNWIKEITKDTKFFYFIINTTVFSLSIILSVICVSILKERVEKTDYLTTELTKLEAKYSDVLKKKYGECDGKNIDKENCDEFKSAKSHLDETTQQIIMIKNIENRGVAKSVCGSISSIASGIPGFENECYKHEIEYKDCLKDSIYDCKETYKETYKDTYKDNRHALIVYLDIKDKFEYLYFEKLPSEILYLILAMVSSTIGSIYKLKHGIKTIYDLKFSDFITSLSQGFIAYIIVMGAKYFVILGNQDFVTNVNPYSIALVGCLAGMFFDSYFIINPKPKTIPVESTSGMG
jgi:hypothetical protein